MSAMNVIAAHASNMRLAAYFFIISVLLASCTLPSAPARPAVYDFGPGARTVDAKGDGALLPSLTLAEVQASSALDSNALLYRLAYADAQQLRPYAMARWSMPPAQLLQQRLRETLGQGQTVLGAGSAANPAEAEPLTLYITLEEFSQVFDAPERSVGLVRLRATLVRNTSAGERVVAQRNVVVQQPATGANAQGGVRALADASDTAARELADWLKPLATAPAGGNASGQR